MTEHAPLILDVAGTELTAADRRRLAHPLTGGVILFARNWENRAQLLQLTSSIKAVRDDLLICVDHEGGRVQRFRTDGFTHLPPMRALGDMWMDDGKGAKGSLYVTRQTLFSHIATRESTQAMADDLFAVVASGRVKIHIDQRYPLAQVQQAHRDLEARKTTGSTILTL